MNKRNLFCVKFLVVAGFLPHDSVQRRREGGMHDLNYILDNFCDFEKVA